METDDRGQNESGDVISDAAGRQPADSARRLLTAVALVAVLIPSLWMVNGCEAPDPDESAPPDQPAETQTDSDIPEIVDICADWPQPAAVLAITGQMHGYLEPCGCSEPQYGGIARRADLLRQLNERDWPVIPLDLGGTLRRSRQQSGHKFQTLMAALRDMKYRAVAVGVEELRQGPSLLLSQYLPDETSPDALDFMAANVVLFGSPDLGTPRRHKIVQAGDIRIGITAVFGPLLKKHLPNMDPGEVEITDPAPALKQAIADLQADSPDLLVLLSHGTMAEATELAKQHPEFQFILTTGTREEPLTDNPVRVGDTTIVQVGHKGKYVGVLGVYPDSEETPFRFEMVRLDGKRFKDPEVMLDHMRSYQEVLQFAKLAESEPSIAHPSGDEFVGIDRCRECHKKATAKWETTGHAHAFDSLRTGRRGIPRIHDPECLSCHVTGWHAQDVYRFDSGWISEEKTKGLAGNQCENCHGPGSRHIDLIEAGEVESARALMKITQKQAREELCITCHDLDNSPHFDFDTYWPKIAHPGLD